jgi:hypothetical protein
MIEAENSTIYLATRHSFLLLTVLYYPMLGEGRSQEILSRKDAKRGMMNSLCASAPLRDISNKAFLNNNFILDFLANNQSSGAIDRLLEQVKSDYNRQDREQEEIRQAQLKAEQLKQQQLQQEKRKKLQKTAQVWLDKLEPFSPEGLWFERFAEKYESKLAAAIDYLLENPG